MSKKRKIGVVKTDEASAENAGGEKFEFPGAADQAELYERLASHRASLRMDTLKSTEEHVSRLKKSFSQAVWVAAERKARVTAQKGKHWVVMGHHEAHSTWLHPEEALWLLANGNLKLVVEREAQEETEDVLTYQRFIRHVFGEAPSQLTMQHYSLYQYLRHIGCVCRRSPLSIPISLLSHSAPRSVVPPVTDLGAVAPMIADVSSLIHRDIYQTLQVISRTPPAAPSANDLADGAPYLIFDVWRAEGVKKFKRSAPPPPVWRVVTIQLSAGVRVPSSAALANIYSRLSVGGAEVMIALVDLRGDKPVFLSLGPETIKQNDSFAKKIN